MPYAFCNAIPERQVYDPKRNLTHSSYEMPVGSALRTGTGFTESASTDPELISSITEVQLA